MPNTSPTQVDQAATLGVAAKVKDLNQLQIEQDLNRKVDLVKNKISQLQD